MKRHEKTSIWLFAFFIVYMLGVFILFSQDWEMVFVALAVFVIIVLLILFSHHKKKHKFFLGHYR